MTVDAEDLAERRHLEVMEGLAALSRIQQTTANEVLELREQLVPGLRQHFIARYYPHFASTVAVALAAAVALGACKP